MERPDTGEVTLKEMVTVRKFRLDEWTEDQITSGEAEPYEVLTVENGVVVDKWTRDDGTDERS